MGLPDNSLLDLIEKVKSWISRGNNYSNSISRESKMDNMCFHCDKSMLDYCLKYHCPSCERVLCGNCDEGLASLDVVKSGLVREAVYNIKSCKRCFELGPVTKRYSGKVYPSEESPRQSPEPPSPSFSGERFDGCSSHVVTKSSNGSPVSVNHSPNRSDKDEGEESTSYFFSTSNEYFRETSDVDSSSVSARHDDLYSFVSVGSSPSDSPSSRINITSNRDGHSVQLDQGETPRSQNDSQEQVILEKPAKGTHDRKNLDHFSIYQNKDEKLPRLLDFETNGPIWLPPPPDDVDDDVENRFFTYDDEDEDDDEVGNSDTDFSSSGGIDNKEPLRAVVLGHFRALVSQLLQGEGIIGINVKSDEWLDTVTAIAWQAANFIKPDTSRGGSMDPCNYVKVKCVASGNPSDSKLVKGVVCTKNIKHKRMTSKYKNTRLLILGGALEYQRVPNQLLSFNTLLQQENDHLKTIVSKIEAHRPNVLLVEKSVSSFAQEHLLTKEISLVLNVKKTLLERIARCTGAIITPSTDHISSTRLGHCELFHLEKFSEEHEPVNQLNRKPLKTLMFFEGCPRRLGCTVLLRGSSREELKKLKHVVHYAVFAAYHLSLETSFLADEGASLPKIAAKRESVLTAINQEEIDVPNLYIGGSANLTLELRLQESLSELVESGCDDVSMSDEFRYRKALLKACDENLALNPAVTKLVGQEEESSEAFENLRVHDDDDGEASGEYYIADDGHQSILVSFSSHCMLNGTLCERPRLLRVKFYGPSDKPLGKYLKDDLFDQSFLCRSCKESAEAHVICYTHQHGNLTINVRHLPSVKLPGKQDGKIWMWHRCLRCAHIDGVPPATRRVVMSDAAWGLSFGKFLELSFSNHATGNRVASCGHSLQRDCLRFYGFGNTVASFQYSPINILSVNLPTSVLEFSGLAEQSWITKEASELSSKAESLYAEISGGLQEIEQKSLSSMHEFSDANDLHNHVLELIETLAKEKNFCQDLLHFSEQEIPQRDQRVMDILEINHFRHSLLIGSQIWERRLSLLDSLLQKIPSPKAPNHNSAHIGLKKDSDSYLKDSSFDHDHEDNFPKYPKVGENLEKTVPFNEEPNSLERLPSAASILSDKIDSSWSENLSLGQINKMENPSLRKSMSPTRVYSFDSAISLQERIRKELPHLSTLHSFHASGDYKYMVRDPVHRSHFQLSSRESEILNLSPRSSLSFLSSTSFLPEGARIIAPKNSENDLVVIIYDNELSSVISYALSSKDYEDRMTDRPSGPETSSNPSLINKVNALASDISKWQSFGSLELDYMQYGSYGSEDNSSAISSTFSDSKNSHHFRIAFEDESSNGAEKVKFSVTCYFAKQFDALRKRCCPSETDFIRSLSRCRRWSAQGGKSNVYFAKSLDERFIIKQVTKTELESFDEFAPEYFKYMTNALSSGSPTCLAKVLGIYQVAVKHSKGGKEIKMDLMVMENLFYGRSISKVYDLKGSARSRYNSDTTGVNKVLLDMNLLETLRTNPIFLGSKAKRILERAVWNDTSFLASVDVMDYSLLVGVDEKRKELVVGIIDFMRQYTWDKHLETWVKASGILGGPKNASPTIISPKQYKKRFRKAMTTYFLTVPDLWLSS